MGQKSLAPVFAQLANINRISTRRRADNFTSPLEGTRSSGLNHEGHAAVLADRLPSQAFSRGPRSSSAMRRATYAVILSIDPKFSGVTSLVSILKP